MDGKFLILIFVGLFLVDSSDGISGGRQQDQNSSCRYLIAIYNYRHDYICTGTILSSTTMVTSASCLGYYPNFQDPDEVNKMMALFARQTNSDRRNRDQTQRIITLAKHNDWIPERAQFDCAVVKVQGFNEKYITAAIIPAESNLIYAGHAVRILGWGAKRENFPNEYILREGHSFIISMKDCMEKYPDEDLDEARFFCTHNRGVGACSGDDGGPVFAKMDATGEHRLIGIIGYRKGCGYPEYPDIHTSIYAVEDFIKKNGQGLKVF